MPIDKSIQMWYNNNRNGEGITPKNQKGINIMVKMVIVANENTTYKPCLDGRDIKSIDQITDEICKAAMMGNTSALTDLAKQLLTLNERNAKAERNEKFIQEICKFIVENIEPNDVLCEDSVLCSVHLNNYTREDTGMLNLVRAALLRLCETKTLKKTRAKVRTPHEKDYEASWRVVYIAL